MQRHAPAVARDLAGGADGVARAFLVGAFPALFTRGFQRRLGRNLVCDVAEVGRVRPVAVAGGIDELNVSERFRARGICRIVAWCELAMQTSGQRDQSATSLQLRNTPLKKSSVCRIRECIVFARS